MSEPSSIRLGRDDRATWSGNTLYTALFPTNRDLVTLSVLRSCPILNDRRPARSLQLLIPIDTLLLGFQIKILHSMHHVLCQPLQSTDRLLLYLAQLTRLHTCQQASALARLAQLGVFDRAERAEREGLLSELSEREDGRSLGQLGRLG